MGDRSGAYRVLVGEPEGKRPLERTRHKWEDNIKINLWEVEWGIDWIDLAQDRDRWRSEVKEVMKLRVTRNTGNVLSSWGPDSFSGRTLLRSTRPFAFVFRLSGISRKLLSLSRFRVANNNVVRGREEGNPVKDRSDLWLQNELTTNREHVSTSTKGISVLRD